MRTGASRFISIAVVSVIAVLATGAATTSAQAAGAGARAESVTSQEPMRSEPAVVSAVQERELSEAATFEQGVRAAALAVPMTNTTACNGRTDFWRLWTAYHGYPVCYANAGTVVYGYNPPHNTWTSYTVCSGNNDGSISYYVGSRFVTDPVYRWTCDYMASKWGVGSVEVADFHIN